MVKLFTYEVRPKTEFELVKITASVRDAVRQSGIRMGMVAVITAHTTTGIMINESLPCVEADIEETLERLVPTDHPYMHAHFLPTYGTTGGNSPGHLKSMLCGNHCLLPVVDGELHCGHAQDIYFAEFDGPKPRKYFVQIIGE